MFLIYFHFFERYMITSESKFNFIGHENQKYRYDSLIKQFIES